MRRSLNVLAVCLFLLGFLVAPAVHLVAAGHDRNTCGDGAGHDRTAPGPHRADQCGVCQLAHTPIALTASIAAPSVAAVTEELLLSPAATSVQRVAYLLPFSCGPPA